MKEKPCAIAIVGPTASGKTSLSIEVAKRYNGEVVSADSRQVYRGLDLGSGKVTVEEMGDVPHHLLDVAEPMEVYTAADFARDAAAAIEGILDRGRCPVVAGGTFFYLDQLRGKSLTAPVEPDAAFRDSLAQLQNATLHELLYKADPARAAAIDPHNRRRLIRALEIVHTLGSVPPPALTESPYQWLVIGIDVPQETLHRNIHDRLVARINDGMIEEVEDLLTQGVTPERLEALGLEYRYCSRYLAGHLGKDEFITELETKIRQFAKRQLTWLRRDEDIEWFAAEDRSAIFRRINTFLHE